MGKVSHQVELSVAEVSVAVQATRVAVGVVILVGLFYYLDVNYSVSKLFDLKSEDIVFIGCAGVIFSLFWILMNKFFWKPYLELFDAREKATVGAEAEYRDVEEEASKVLEKYEELVMQARTQAMKKKLSQLGEAKQKAQKILDDAQTQSQNLLNEARKEILKEKESLMQGARHEAESLANILVNRIVM
jgi:F-type H+-transporting ATPase subunit b